MGKKTNIKEIEKGKKGKDMKKLGKEEMEKVVGGKKPKGNRGNGNIPPQ